MAQVDTEGHRILVLCTVTALFNELNAFEASTNGAKFVSSASNVL